MSSPNAKEGYEPGEIRERPLPKFHMAVDSEYKVCMHIGCIKSSHTHKHADYQLIRHANLRRPYRPAACPASRSPHCLPSIVFQ